MDAADGLAGIDPNQPAAGAWQDTENTDDQYTDFESGDHNGFDFWPDGDG